MPSWDGPLSTITEQKAKNTPPIMKTISTLAATLGAALLLAGSPVLASEPTQQTGPIRIENAQLFGNNLSDEDTSSSVPSSIKIDFTNNGNSPATHVVFAIESDGVVLNTIDDAGSFAKGATISHTFNDDELSSEQQVAVEQATFADGTVWNNPDVPGGAAQASNVSVDASPEF
jgi:hypothetical protein